MKRGTLLWLLLGSFLMLPFMSILAANITGKAGSQEIIYNDVELLQLHGPVKQIDIDYFGIPLDALSQLDEDNIEAFHHSQHEYQFDEEGFYKEKVIQIEYDFDYQSTLQSIYYPFQDGQREYHDFKLDDQSLLEAKNNREYIVQTEWWEDGDLKRLKFFTTLEAMERNPIDAEIYVTETNYFDAALNLIDEQSVDEAGNTQRNLHRYISFEEYISEPFQEVLKQSEDIPNPEISETIHVNANQEDLQNFTKEDFEQLDPRMMIIVKENVDERGNAQTEWIYTSEIILKKHYQFSYY